MAFYLPPSERFNMESQVKEAINKALDFMDVNRIKQD
jgi:hypothetical protein